MTDRPASRCASLQPGPGGPWRLRLVRALTILLTAVAVAPRLAGGAEAERSLLPSAWIRNGMFVSPATSPESFLPARLTGPQTAGNDLPVEFPEAGHCSIEIKESWREWQRLAIELTLPADFPRGGEVWVFTKDWDLLWRQVRQPIPASGSAQVQIEVPVTGPEAAAAWEPSGHERPWRTLTPSQIVELGIKFVPPKGFTGAYKGTVRVQAVRLRGQARTPATLAVHDLALGPREVHEGETVEASFELADFRGNPYDAAEVGVEAEVRLPAGGSEKVPGFYAEDFILRPTGEKGQMVPYGAPRFKVRYMPRVAGRHEMTLTVRSGNLKAAVAAGAFEVRAAKPAFKGVIRADAKDHRYLSFADGEVFAGLGINARSPYDTRHEAMVPQTLWQDQGLEFYREAFPRYQAAGINVAEVWMSSWWLALEWIPDAPGNHGVGTMNQYRAWQLDELMRLAEKHGIYVVLVLNNHGKFSTICDQEWGRNPYNVANGGFLADNEAYFTDPRAKAAFKRTADYIVARWAHSPNLLAWKLFSEINLTGKSSNFYGTDAMIEWHREMSAYLHERDLYDHLVTTHWSSNFHVINPPVASLAGLDFLTTDAYGGNTAQVMDFIEGTSHCADRYAKPTFITEFGGSPMGDSLGSLRNQLHLANWQGFLSQMAVPPMFWWFAIVDEQDLYGEYKAVRAFMAGEDARGMLSTSRTLAAEGLSLTIMQGRNRALIWGYDRQYFLADVETLVPREVGEVTIDVSGLKPGRHPVEHWDCATGAVVRRTEVIVDPAGAAQIRVPPFRRDFAIKILPEKPTEAK